VWLIEVDTARKVLRSVTRYDGESFNHGAFLPSEVSRYLDAHPRGGINGFTTAAGETTANSAYHGGNGSHHHHAKQLYCPDARKPSHPNRPPGPSGPSGRGNNNSVVCQLCGEVGHVASCCFKRFRTDFLGAGNDGRYIHMQVAAATLTRKRT
jgi:hypothetical protein